MPSVEVRVMCAGQRELEAKDECRHEPNMCAVKLEALGDVPHKEERMQLLE